MSPPALPPLPARRQAVSSDPANGPPPTVNEQNEHDDPAANVEPDTDGSPAPAPTPYSFKLNRALLAFVLPMPAFLQLPANKGVEVMVGVVVVRRMPEYDGEAVEDGGDGDSGEEEGGEEDEHKGENGGVRVGQEDGIEPNTGERGVDLDRERAPDPRADAGAHSFRTAPSPPQPGAVLLRRLPSSPSASASASLLPTSSSTPAWDIPTSRIKRGAGGDTTLLETVARCVREQLGGEVNEMVRLLGVSSVPVPVDAGGLMEDGKRAKHGMARRYDFLVRLHPNAHASGGAAGSGFAVGRIGTEGLRAREGWEMRWVDTDEVWRVMRRLGPAHGEVGGVAAGTVGGVGVRNGTGKEASDVQARTGEGAGAPPVRVGKEEIEAEKADGDGVEGAAASVSRLALDK